MTMRPEMTLVFPKPGKALLGVMITISCAWVMISVALNYGGADASLIMPFVGDPSRILHGQLWRLVSPILIHQPQGDGSVGHILMTMLGLYFLAPTLEERWGWRKMLVFLLGSAAFGFACQVLVGLAIPKLATPHFFGGLGMVEAVAVAWALQARNQTVRLFFIIPVTGTMLLAFVFFMSVLNVIAQKVPPEGLVTPFGGMLAGYLFSEVSPLRRVWLRLRLRRLQSQAAALRGVRTSPAGRDRLAAHGLRVIQGGGDDKPKDKRYLN